ncbi:MAG TPA: hypothetical protein ENJ20_04975 [Bacteroidetes bacterium]|nr:hypothetical protein [Bacteroidota bacterium]
MGTTFKCIRMGMLCMVVCAMVVLQVDAQKIIYVKPGSNGDGSCWQKAFSHLQTALYNARAGTQIWVAAGTYHPTEGADRTVSFIIPAGVKVFGGFNGTEEKLEQRRPDRYPSVLSGDIGGPGREDNSYNIVLFENAGPDTWLDGFTLTGGFANGEGGTPHGKGGAIYNDGRQGRSSPKIRYCIFTKNFARDGGAVYNDGAYGQSNPLFENCIFSENEAGLDGGAVFNDSRNGESNPVFRGCTFRRNLGTYGGAICHAADKTACTLTLENCSFIENASYLRGGGVFTMAGAEKCAVEMADNFFKNNYPDDMDTAWLTAEARSIAWRIKE